MIRVAAALLGLVIALAGSAQAETWPARPIRMIVPIAAGGPTDTVSRLLAVHLAEDLGQQVVIDNKPGASGMIGMQAAQHAPADGYTLVMGNAGSIGLSLAIFKDVTYSPDDFVSISMVMTVPIILVVRPELPDSVPKLIARLKAEPTRLAFASSGFGQTPYMATELFRQQAGLETVVVPFKGAAPAAQDVLAGNTQLMFDSTPTVPFIRQGVLRALAVCSPQRSALMPDVPTMQEAGLEGFDVTSWYVAMAPAATPRPIVDRLNRSITSIMARDDVKAKLAALNAEAISSTPEAADAYVRAQLAHYRAVVARTGIKPQ